MVGNGRTNTPTVLCWYPTEKTIDWVLLYQQYQDQLVDQAALMLTLSGRVSETQQVLAHQTSFRLRTPDLQVEVGRAWRVAWCVT